MASQAEVVRNRIIGGEEPLRVPGLLEARHASFTLAGGLVRILRAVIQGPMVAVLHAGQELSPRRLVALEFIGDEHPRYIPQSLEEFAKEAFSRNLIATALDQDIENLAILIDRPPELVPLAMNRAKHLIQVP
jgi:hypothetical protein